ncbi:RagB/SusD family nutrient uptake outer membrane protein [Tellurirhabdus rosea]|uniref:RagB/SusD family nutrient uptake outer membrane protein n=1 Tax=Tellurirhabdus rosea TaxID=2674997 RepID=UPI002257701A|nr:RagB/SusD family nutrient uptake outer membrane protein [Tellurirhabdus rosea]
MKYTVKFLLVAGALSLGSCSKDYLEAPQPTAQISPDQVFSTPDGARAFFNGIYRRLRSQWINLNETAGNSTDAWGVVSVNLAREMKGDDIINPGGWYQFDYRHENREPTYRRTIFTWAFFYEFINQANIMIDGVQKSNFPEATKTRYIAEARALRAWLYFETIREFQHTYLKDPNAPGIPVYTEPTGIETTGKGRGTVQQVYDQINADIDFAVANLDNSRLLKSNIDKNVALGLQARIALEQGQWAKAETAAIAARQGYALNAAQYKTGFKNIDSEEWMWAFPNTETDGQTLYYGIPNSFFAKAGNGYDNFFINEEFVKKFTTTDVRNLFQPYTSTNVQRKWSTTKFGDDLDFNAAMPMMRVSEMYLIEAEAKAEQGKQAAAADVLYTLQKNRDPQAVKSAAATKAALIDEILLERRKELYGELGIQFLDVKRRQLPLVRTGNHSPAFKFNIPANDPRFVLKIPFREIDANPNINPEDQNQ